MTKEIGAALLVCAWAAVAEKYHAGEISRDDYDKWRYYYPQYDDTQITAKVPSQELNDAMNKAVKDTIKDGYKSKFV